MPRGIPNKRKPMRRSAPAPVSPPTPSAAAPTPALYLVIRYDDARELLGNLERLRAVANEVGTLIAIRAENMPATLQLPTTD